jgi:polysaccharide chain length determinant protein (PEP-CTERM system associated)
MNAERASMPDQAESGGGIGLDRLRAAWSRRKWLGLTLFVLPLAAGVSLVLSLPNVYRSTATVLIERQHVPEEYVRPTVTGELEARLTTMSQEVLSRPRLEPLIKRLDLYADMRRGETEGPRMEAAIERMRNEVKLELRESASGGPRRQTIAFGITYSGRNPGTVALATNTLASSYVEENLRAREQRASGTTEFVRVQLAEAKARLDEQEQKLSALKARYGGEGPQHSQGNIARLETLSAQLRTNSDNQVRLAERRESLQVQLAQLSSESGIESDEARLQRLRGQLTELRLKYTDLWPDIIRLKHEIAELEKRVAEPKPKKPKAAEIPATPQALRVQEALKTTETELALLKTEEARMRASIATLQLRLDNAPQREQEFADVTRDYDSMRELYVTLLKRYGEAQIAEAMEQRQKGEQFKLVEPAVPAYAPTAPNRMRLLAVVLAASLALGVGTIVLAELVDTSFHGVSDLRSFSTVPVIVAIPRILTEGDVRRRRRRLRLGAAAVAIGLVVTWSAGHYLASDNEALTNLLSPKRQQAR